MKIDPIHQFNIEPLFTIGHIGNHTIAFTNSSLYMLVTVAIISLLMLASGTQLVPGRLQSVAEISYEFVASTVRSTAGAEGMKFFPLIFSLFMFICVSILVPHGVPGYILPLVMFIEILSFFLRPVSHSVRLFANMLAGHIALKVFAGFVAMLGVSLGALGWFGGMLPLALTVALTALELLVAFLQAYVFAILTCIYLNDAIHPGH